MVDHGPIDQPQPSITNHNQVDGWLISGGWLVTVFDGDSPEFMANEDN